MIGLDTNLIVRLFIDDDAIQTRKARQFVKENCSPGAPGFINAVVLVETMWVLESLYGYERSDVRRAVAGLMSNSHIALERPEIVHLALEAYSQSNADFTDVLICEINRGWECESTATFDRKVARLDGFTLVA